MTITLATLSQATAQEVFDQVATHLLKQKTRSTSENGCAYRGPNGLKCAAGCLISDEEYKPDMEGAVWTRLFYNGYVSSHHMELIRGLQIIHDSYPPAEWEHELKTSQKKKD